MILIEKTCKHHYLTSGSAYKNVISEALHSNSDAFIFELMLKFEHKLMIKDLVLLQVLGEFQSSPPQSEWFLKCPT